ncbi:MAG: hypothetical protein COU69_04780 [Candidatus Pacebacteria bacterium CG10_big_fil_rev_8_21_14_0_10_56_10]|nr:MAG: hypothetical protein COU69_04780 [Candidatus Pacebacteria bacterium CG10_big_fil_rev_8_21_14_0_10_56_10]
MLSVFSKLVRRRWTTLVLTAVVLAAGWSLLRPGFFRAHDFTHGARIVEMARGLEDGQLPVRWSRNLGYGYGMPLFEFYAPLPFFVGAVPWLAGVELVTIIKLLYLATTVGTAWGGYLLGRQLFGRSGGVLTAAALTLAPYRAVNIFVRGALSEAAGIMFLPWILWSLIILIEAGPGSFSRSDRSGRAAALALTASLTGLLLTHNLTALMFVPFSLVFAGLYILTGPQWHQAADKLRCWWRQLLGVVRWYILTIGLSAFYVFPALLEKGFTKVDSILGGYFDYSLHFLYIRQFWQPNWGYGGSVWGPDDDISFFLGFGQLAVAILVAVAIAWQGYHWWRQGNRRRLPRVSSSGWTVVIAAGLLVASLFLSLLKAKFIWDVLPLINFIQFPWRWLAVAIVWLAVLVGGSTLLLPKSRRRSWALIWTVVILLANVWFFQPESYLDDPSDFYYHDASMIRREMSGILPDFIPATLNVELAPAAERTRCRHRECLPEEMTVLIDRSHQLLVETRLKNPEEIVINVADFPGWRLELDGQPIDKTTTSDGLIIAEMPVGQHRLGVLLDSTPVRSISDATTAVSLLAAGLVFVELRPAGKGGDDE